jgi:hypothetical protein
MSRWWSGIPAAQADIPCCGAIHTLRWQDGELTAVNHNDHERRAGRDGEPVPCLDLVSAWSRRSRDPYVLTLASRGLTDPLTIDTDLLRFGDGPRRQTVEQTLRLLALGGRLPDRLQATTAAIWTRRLRSGHADLHRALPTLEAALYGRARQTLRGWLGGSRLQIELTMIEPAQTRSIVRTPQGVDIHLPFSWLSEVWARGLAITGDRLCLAADTKNGADWTLTTLDRDLSEPTQLTIGAL